MKQINYVKTFVESGETQKQGHLMVILYCEQTRKIHLIGELFSCVGKVNNIALNTGFYKGIFN